MQGELVAHQMVKNAINKGPASMNLLLKFVEAHEARQARQAEIQARKQAEGSTEIDWDAEKEELAKGCWPRLPNSWRHRMRTQND
jgi:hypothetical protein